MTTAGRLAVNKAVVGIVGFVLLTAATVKVVSMISEPVVWKGLQTNHFLTGLLSLIEIVVGAFLVSSVCLKRSVAAAIFLFVCFAGYSAYKTILGSRTCDCLGKIELAPIVIFVFDVVVVVFLASCYHSLTTPQGSLRLRARNLVVFASIVFLFCAGLVASTFSWRPLVQLSFGSNGLESFYSPGDFVAIDPVDLVGHRFDLVEYIEGGDALLRDNWVVIFSRKNCTECQRLGQHLKSNRSEFTLFDNTRVAFLETSPIEWAPVSAGDESEIREYILDTSYRWVVETPSAVFVSNGIVVKTIEIESLFSGEDL